MKLKAGAVIQNDGWASVHAGVPRQPFIGQLAEGLGRLACNRTPGRIRTKGYFAEHDIRQLPSVLQSQPRVEAGPCVLRDHRGGLVIPAKGDRELATVACAAVAEAERLGPAPANQKLKPLYFAIAHLKALGPGRYRFNAAGSERRLLVRALLHCAFPFRGPAVDQKARDLRRHKDVAFCRLSPCSYDESTIYVHGDCRAES